MKAKFSDPVQPQIENVHFLLKQINVGYYRNEACVEI